MILENKEQITAIINKISLALIGILLVLFPLFFSSQTTDIFILLKQALIGAGSLGVLLLFALKCLLNNKVIIRRNPFDLPVLIFTLAVFLSSIFAVNKVDSFISFIPFLFIVFAYFAIVNTAKTKTEVLFVLSSLIAGALISSLFVIFSFLKIYPLPIALTQAQTFTTLGSLLDQALYIGFVLPLAAYLAFPFILAYTKGRKQSNELETANPASDLAKLAGFGLSTIIILIGLIVTIYELITLQKPVFLPLETGFQTAFAAISQDSSRLIQGFLFGAGFGNFGVVFSRFKQAAFNLDPNLWSFTFFRSSSFILELLATTGVLGLLTFLFLVYKVVRERPVFIPLILIIAAGFILPFSFSLQALLFIFLAIFVALSGLEAHKENRFFDVELQLVALKKGFLSLAPTEEEKKSEQEGLSSKILPMIIFAIIALLVLGLGFLSTRYILSNIKFQQSLVAASKNDGNLTYTNQKDALQLFSFSDSYNRVFSQTNLSLASNLVSSLSNKSAPNAQTTQTIYTLIQQSINAGRQATTLSPQTAVNWQNLASIYRNLIGFGQNADSFAILSAQQAISLDPNNPNEYINLGGIYYQLNQWDKALPQFQQAINLKPDLPNAYYNLGHTLIQKGDLKGGLAQFQTVKTLVANDPANLAKINAEIKDLQNQIDQPAQVPAKTPQPSTSLLPNQEQQVKIQGPSVSPLPSSSPTPTVTPKP